MRIPIKNTDELRGFVSGIHWERARRNAEEMREQGYDETSIDAMYKQMEHYLQKNYEQALATWERGKQMSDGPSFELH